MWFWIIAAVVGVVLLALAWWSSGRSKKRFPGASPAGEIQRGDATLQAVKHRMEPPGSGGPSAF